ncbi:MAG TPA: hypothetical protein VLF69_00040 [Candidatus Saccharimonadales bacterium]|nr:hypothetical protein [Candidatus Saccharimonadales bacterium]
MQQHSRTLKRLLVQPAVVMFAIAIGLLLVSIICTHLHRSYNSDDVSWQVVLFHWRPFSGQTVSLGSSDNFVDKIPFFFLLEHVFSPGRKLLLLESSILAVGGFTGFYISALYFLRKAGVKLQYVTLLPFVWIASFGFAFAQLYLCPIWRGFETGLSFVTIMLTAMVYYREVQLRSWLSRTVFVVITAITGLLIYSDPYYLYFTIGFIGLFWAALRLLRKVSNRQLAIVYGGIVLALLFSKLTAWLSMQAGIRIVAVYPAQFVDFETLGHNIIIALHGLLISFGADFFGKPFSPHLGVIVGILNFSLLATLLCTMYRALRGGQLKLSTSATNLWMAFFSGLAVFVFTVYTVSTLTDISTYRYFFLLVFSGMIVLALLLGKLGPGPVRLFLSALLILATLGNVAASLHGSTGYIEPGDLGGNVRNQQNYQFISALKSRGLKKGYANYWQADINTYLSNDAISFLPSLCSPEGKVTTFHWLIDNARFSQPTSRSFFLYDPDIPNPATCTISQVKDQFGKPAQVLSIADKTVLIYNYDIASKLAPEQH